MHNHHRRTVGRSGSDLVDGSDDSGQALAIFEKLATELENQRLHYNRPVRSSSPSITFMF